MRKHLAMTVLLMSGMAAGTSMQAWASPDPEPQSQAVTTITGTVYDENNEPVIGAGITPRGAKNGAVTDFAGNFSINVRPGTPLVISFVGYKTVTMNAAQGMRVYMQPTTEVLNEVVEGVAELPYLSL